MPVSEPGRSVLRNLVALCGGGTPRPPRGAARPPGPRACLWGRLSARVTQARVSSACGRSRIPFSVVHLLLNAALRGGLRARPALLPRVVSCLPSDGGLLRRDGLSLSFRSFFSPFLPPCLHFLAHPPTSGYKRQPLE